MRDFVFVNKTSGDKCTLRTDIIDGNDRFTVMWLEGVVGTEFEKFIPFNQSTVTTVEEIAEWFKDYSSTYDGYIYGGEQLVVIGAETFPLTITPTIDGSNAVKICLNATKEGANPIQDVIELTNGKPKVLQMISGYRYNITLPKGEITSGDPGTWTASAAKEVELEIAIPAP